jgi:hypothetical protein
MLGVKAGLCYFAIVFAAGFVLGMLRVLIVIPRIGELAAVLAELPVMLAISWLACGWLVKRFAVPARMPDRLAMGAIAFALLMAAELALSVYVFHRSPAAYVASYLSAPGAIGLAGQIAFALFPLLRTLKY